MSILYELANNPAISRTFRALNLRTPARNFYHFLRGKQPVSLSVADCHAAFPCKSAQARRRIEPMKGDEGVFIEALLKHCRSDDVFFDIGAEFGVYGILAASKCRKVVCIEPIPQSAEEILAAKATNNLGNVDVHNIAVGNIDGIIRMSGGKNGADHCPRVSDQGDVEVPICRLETLVKRFCTPNPTVVKLDVEGFERQALEGMGSLLNDIRIMFVEIHPHLSSAEDVNAVNRILASAGFALEQLPQRPPEIHLMCTRS